MTNDQADVLDRQVELLHTYHLDLWNEVEAQLRVLRLAQDEIAKLRETRAAEEPSAVAVGAAQMLAQHVRTLKGRVATLGATVSELEGTVAELVRVLSR